MHSARGRPTPAPEDSVHYRCVFKIVDRDLLDMPLCGDELFFVVSEPECRRQHEHSSRGAPPRTLSALCRVRSLRAHPLPCPPARVSPAVPGTRAQCPLRGCLLMSTHACAWWHLSRDAKVVEKQRETPTVDRPPPTLALNTTASKSVQVNGAASVRALRGGGMPRASQKGWPHVCAAGLLHRVPGPWVIIPADHCGYSSSEELWLSALVPRGSEGSPSRTPLLFLLFLSYNWLMEMTDFKCPLLSFSLHASTYLETPFPFFKLLPLTFLHHTSRPLHGRPSSSPVPEAKWPAKAAAALVLAAA